ncbi:MAG: glycosyltransferase [Nitrospirota bacterium]
MTKRLEKYASIVGREEINEIISLADCIRSQKVQNINSTKNGGGVAEILGCLIPLFHELEVDISWDVIKGNRDFFEITKTIHNALHGEEVEISAEILDIYLDTVASNYNIIKKDADFIIIHDPQPIPLIIKRNETEAKWIWRCHIDLTEADFRIMGFLWQHISRFDCSVYHLPNYSTSSFFQDEYIIPPAIDPLHDKNRELAPEEIVHELHSIEIEPDIPIILQVSRFDRLKDPIGVIRAFNILQNEGINAQLILAGSSAADDPEGERVYNEVLDFADNNPVIHILQLPSDSHLKINALQRAATVVVQKSIREGFGLVVTEAMWKAKPVVGGNVGGIQKQIIHGETGFLVNTVEGTAYRIQQLINNPELAKKMGKEARHNVLTNYLMPSLLKNWLLLFLSLRHKGRGIIHL